MKIDLRHSKIENMTNADVVNNYYGTRQNKSDILSGLQKLQLDFNSAASQGKLSSAQNDALQSQMSGAIVEASKDKADKVRVISFLDRAKDVVESTIAVAGLFDALKKGAELLIPLL